MKPYQLPTSLTSIKHIALSSKSFRVFGLNSQAWNDARDKWNSKKRQLQQSEGDNLGEGDEGDEEELQIICNAITTALSEDAGGYGTAGFHVNKVEQVKQLPNLPNNNNNNESENNNSVAVYNATLIPCNANGGEPIVPISVVDSIGGSGGSKEKVAAEGEEGRTFMGNDKFYLEQTNIDDSSSSPHFQIRITISKAYNAICAKEYYETLCTKRHELSCDKLIDVESWVSEDEELMTLRQQVFDSAGDTPKQPQEQQTEALGYYVDLMLIEPQVKPDEIVIAPPLELDKAHPTLRTHPASDKYNNEASSTRPQTREEEYNTTNNVFERDIYESIQFTTSTTAAVGPWERLNLKVFNDIGLDIRKALARVEFPIFEEGCKEKTFREVYQLNARLKSGSFATVCRGTHRATGKKVAIKCVLRKDLPPGDDAAIYDEVLILSTLRHSSICPLIDFFEERECYFLIMELMSGGDLFDRIGSKKCYTENDARKLCRTLLESLRFCHDNSVAHCDMKPKNLLLVSDDDDVQMKLADFGFATRVYEPKSLTKQCGTPFFVAPEVLMRSPYDQKSDMWSCGVIMFLLLGGDLPFIGRSQKELFRNIVMGKYEFEEEAWSHVSEDAKQLIKQLLITDPSKRLSSNGALKSSWMCRRGSMLALNKLQYTSRRLAGFNARQKLRASMLAVTSIQRMMISARSMESNRSLNSHTQESSAGRSFLDNLPMEGEGSENKEETGKMLTEEES